MFSNYEKLSYTQNFNDTKTDDVSELRAQNQNEKKKKVKSEKSTYMPVRSFVFVK